MSVLTSSQECLSPCGGGPSSAKGCSEEARNARQKWDVRRSTHTCRVVQGLSPHKRVPGRGEHLLLDVGAGYTKTFSSRKPSGTAHVTCTPYVGRASVNSTLPPKLGPQPSRLSRPGPGPLLSGWLASLVLLWGSLVHRSQHPCGRASRRWGHSGVQPCSGLAVGRCQ